MRNDKKGVNGAERPINLMTSNLRCGVFIAAIDTCGDGVFR